MELTLNARPLSPLAGEAALLDAARHGDDRAFEELYARYRERIHAFILSKVRDHGRAEDLGQEVFMSALRQLRGRDQQIVFKPWLYAIAKNACIDEFRRGSRRSEVSVESDEELGASSRFLAAIPTPSSAIECKQSMDDLRGAFGGLSDSQHKLLVMREFEGLSYDEIGERLGMTRQMVESGLFRARRKLTEEYDELASGRRCEQIQAAIEAGTLATVRGMGIKDRRRYSRHLSHCQLCRHQALMARVDASLLTKRSLAAKIAALLPFPLLAKLSPFGHGGRAAAAKAASGKAAATGTAGAGAGAAGAGAGLGPVAAVAALALAGAGGGVAIAAHSSSPQGTAPPGAHRHVTPPVGPGAIHQRVAAPPRSAESNARAAAGSAAHHSAAVARRAGFHAAGAAGAAGAGLTTVTGPASHRSGPSAGPVTKTGIGVAPAATGPTTTNRSMPASPATTSAPTSPTAPRRATAPTTFTPVSTAATSVGTTVTTAGGAAGTTVDTAAGAVATTVTAASGAVGTTIGTAGGAVGTTVGTAGGAVGTTVGTAGGAVGTTVGTAGGAVGTAVGGVGAGTPVAPLTTAVGATAAGATAGGATAGGVSHGVGSTVGGVSDGLGSTVGGVSTTAGSTVTGVTRALGGSSADS